MRVEDLRLTVPGTIRLREVSASEVADALRAEGWIVVERDVPKSRKCGCVADGTGRRYWKHVGQGGFPETALCEPFGGCSHPCTHGNHRTLKRAESSKGVE